MSRSDPYEMFPYLHSMEGIIAEPEQGDSTIFADHIFLVVGQVD